MSDGEALQNYEKYVEKQFELVQKYAKRFEGMKVYLSFHEIHIQYLGDEFFYEPVMGDQGKIRLMHRNARHYFDTKQQGEYHQQFRRRISPQSIVMYCYRHGQKTYHFNTHDAFHINKVQKRISIYHEEKN